MMGRDTPEHSTNKEPSYSRLVSPSSTSSVVMDLADDIVHEAVPPPPIPSEKSAISLTTGDSPDNPNPSSPDSDVELLKRLLKAAPQMAREAAALPSPPRGVVPFLANIRTKALYAGNRTFFNVPHKDDGESHSQVIPPDSVFTSKLA
ncbi:hypothetical protein Aduo_012816 [Ancylostoma duodenale]